MTAGGGFRQRTREANRQEREQEAAETERKNEEDRRKAVELRAEGKDPLTIADVTGRHPAWIRRVLATDESKREIAELRRQMADAAAHVLAEGAATAARTMVQLAGEAKDERVRLQAAGEVLDRVGLGAEKVAEGTSVSVVAAHALISAGPQALRAIDAAALRMLGSGDGEEDGSSE